METLFMGQLGGVGDRRVDMHGLEGRVAPQDGVPGGSLGQAVEDVGHEDAGALGTELASADAGVAGQMPSPGSAVGAEGLHVAPSLGNRLREVKAGGDEDGGASHER